jgi:DnaJ-class molecular chaperone
MVDVLRTCPKCFGDGEHETDIPGGGGTIGQTCPTCDGVGRLVIGYVDITDLTDKVGDIVDKCNDILERVSEGE